MKSNFNKSGNFDVPDAINLEVYYDEEEFKKEFKEMLEPYEFKNSFKISEEQMNLLFEGDNENE